MLKDFDDLLQRKFYVADCELVQFSVDRNNTEEKLNAKGYATLVSGDVELEFNWFAQGRASKGGDLAFKVTLDEIEPDFNLLGVSGISEELERELCEKILASCNWQTEVAECLPTNDAELASL
jgi:hypothetical protein